MIDLSLEAGGIRFKNPVVASSGSITLTMKHMKKCIEAGVGAITTKCISTEALTWGVFRPRHTFLDKFGYPGSLHSIELAFRTPEEGEEDIKQIKHLAEEKDVRIISNITATGLDKESWQRLAILSQEAGADMVEILLVCPHGGDLTAVAEGKVGRFLGMDPEMIFSIVKMVKDVVDIPVIAKIGPSTNEALLAEVVLASEKGGADFLHLAPMVNYGIGAIDVETAMPSNPYGGCTGRQMRYIGLTTTALVAPITKKPILSSGGIANWRESIERMMAGSQLVGIHTEVLYRGYKVFREVLEGMEVFMERKGYKNVTEIIGKALPNIGTIISLRKLPEPKGAVIAAVDSETCNGCSKCIDTCMYEAIEIIDKIAVINVELCEGCGACASVCRQDAITIEAVKEDIK